jgi:hypothetical protein
MVSLEGVVISIYARRGGLSDNDTLLRYSATSSMLVALVFLGSIPVAFLDATIGKLLWLLLWPVGLLARRIAGWNRPAEA